MESRGAHSSDVLRAPLHIEGLSLTGLQARSGPSAAQAPVRSRDGGEEPRLMQRGGSEHAAMRSEQCCNLNHANRASAEGMWIPGYLNRNGGETTTLIPRAALGMHDPMLAQTKEVALSASLLYRVYRSMSNSSSAISSGYLSERFWKHGRRNMRHQFRRCLYQCCCKTAQFSCACRTSGAGEVGIFVALGRPGHGTTTVENAPSECASSHIQALSSLKIFD